MSDALDPKLVAALAGMSPPKGNYTIHNTGNLGGDVDGAVAEYTGSDDSGAPSATPGMQAAMRGARTKLGEREKHADELLAGAERKLGDLRTPPMLQQYAAPEAQHTHPMETWGSLAMMFAMFGSLATRRPFTTALNAAAALNNAVAAGDHERTQDAFNKWKIESENAQKMAQWEHEHYQDQLANIKTGLEFVKEARPQATAFKDEVFKQLVDAGRYDDAMSWMTNRGKASGQLTATRQAALDDGHTRLQNYRDIQDARNAVREAEKSGDQAAIDAANARLNEVKQRVDDYAYTTTKGMGAQNSEETRRYHDVQAGLVGEKIDEIKRRNAVVEGQGDRKQDETERRNTVTEGQTNRKLTIEESRAAETARHNSAIEAYNALKPANEAERLQIERAKLEETRRYHDMLDKLGHDRINATGNRLGPPQQLEIQQDDGTKKTVMARLGQKGWVTADDKQTPINTPPDKFRIMKGAEVSDDEIKALLGPGGMDLAALDYIRSKSLPTFGLGNAGYKAKALIVTRAAEIAKERGFSPEDIAAIRAGNHSESLALSVLARSRANVKSFEETARKESDLALELMDKGAAPGTSPMFNRWTQAVRRGVYGDPDVAAFQAALVSFKNEYAKIMSSPGATGAQTTDSARAEADTLINGSMNKETLKRTIATMKRGMDNRIKSINEEYTGTVKTIHDLTLPSAGGASGGGGDTEIHYDSQGRRVQ